ncbi:MAG TPA: hypothetical protein VFH47_05720 [Candidatus Thermoplasmatota archaeon]|nr:hypothetical protein [Candidatus Thermoplasmatota archaeon]
MGPEPWDAASDAKVDGLKALAASGGWRQWCRDAGLGVGFIPEFVTFWLVSVTLLATAFAVSLTWSASNAFDVLQILVWGVVAWGLGMAIAALPALCGIAAMRAWRARTGRSPAKLVWVACVVGWIGFAPALLAENTWLWDADWPPVAWLYGGVAVAIANGWYAWVTTRRAMVAVEVSVAFTLATGVACLVCDGLYQMASNGAKLGAAAASLALLAAAAAVLERTRKGQFWPNALAPLRRELAKRRSPNGGRASIRTNGFLGFDGRHVGGNSRYIPTSAARQALWFPNPAQFQACAF